MICKHCGDPIEIDTYGMWTHIVSGNIHCYDALQNEIHHAQPKGK